MKAWDALLSAFESLQSTSERDRMKLPFKDLRKVADHERMQWIVSDIEHMNNVDKRKHVQNTISNTPNTKEDLHAEIHFTTAIALQHIQSMSSEDIAKNNNNYNFKRYPTLHAAADSCIGLIEAYEIDSRDLSIAFSNEFVYTPRTTTYEESDKLYNDVSKNGKYVIDVPHDQILSAMSQMEYFARKKSPKWVKSNFHIPKKAYETHESFLKFMKRFYKKHGMFWAE